jgi:transposase InsO family protein
MSKKGDCWDNAVAESFFATLKKQSIYGQLLQSRQKMRLQIFEFIEIYYNRFRSYSANGWVTPVDLNACIIKT